MQLEDLNAKTRAKMKEEIERDADEGKLYLSNRLSEQGQKAYSTLLSQAADSGTPQTLRSALQPFMQSHYTTTTQKIRKVPRNAAELLAVGQFNHFYVRGMCVRAIEEGRELKVYRAKQVKKPRQKSQRLVGTSVDPQALLQDLRNGLSYESNMDVPGGPGSKISVRFKEDESDQ